MYCIYSVLPSLFSKTQIHSLDYPHIRHRPKTLIFDVSCERARVSTEQPHLNIVPPLIYSKAPQIEYFIVFNRILLFSLLYNPSSAHASYIPSTLTWHILIVCLIVILKQVTNSNKLKKFNRETSNRDISRIKFIL